MKSNSESSISRLPLRSTFIDFYQRYKVGHKGPPTSFSSFHQLRGLDASQLDLVDKTEESINLERTFEAFSLHDKHKPPFLNAPDPALSQIDSRTRVQQNCFPRKTLRTSSNEDSPAYFAVTRIQSTSKANLDQNPLPTVNR